VQEDEVDDRAHYVDEGRRGGANAAHCEHQRDHYDATQTHQAALRDQQPVTESELRTIVGHVRDCQQSLQRGRHTDAGVLHREAQYDSLFVSLYGSDRNGDVTFLGELDGGIV
jgi:hypothetical protein